MCGAISTPCRTNGCEGYARYDVYCHKCNKITSKKRTFLRRGE